MVKTQPASVVSCRITKVNAATTSETGDFLAVEEPLEIRIAYQESGRAHWKTISVTMRTPGNDRELAAGFLFTEGIIQSINDIKKIESSVFEENLVLVTLSDSCSPNLHTSERNFYTTSSCGVCGKTSIDAITTVLPFNLPNTLHVNRELLFTLGARLSGQQNIFEETGGLHAASLFAHEGTLLHLCEDVGRHNALDKLIGAALLADQLPLAGKILLLSGRASFELIQKALMAGIELVAAIGAPSSLAVKLAEAHHLTLVGFLKNDRFNVYTGYHRITGL
ncbi:formate dehydrogenase accessory sulfurtransferase FdhD [Dyadobacter aurulentus]|uniref:formate dehydrogenase accessory sulfurtransferase FdhD n=1 Tax=Dyadobacter sp. UC 10 TaxID=2605428 RepID=UPI0011F3F37E|nr:formate dehydrogenase accessory sulfurtransferase FdhD [Dyadobacter sp. UC 10]KAA0991706.1 formate dehydrogenase accessory sulfurtransferase FdhD [Dyadobacter sp. UC 10]